MKNILPERLAALGLVVLLALFVVFHLLILTGIIPYQMVWGGRLQTREQMLSFESVSIAMNLIMLAIAAIAAGLLRVKVNCVLLRIALGAMGLLFLLNTVGNAFSLNSLEKMIFTPVTLVLAVFCIRMVFATPLQLKPESKA